jgi:hypothetical protein
VVFGAGAIVSRRSIIVVAAVIAVTSTPSFLHVRFLFFPLQLLLLVVDFLLGLVVTTGEFVEPFVGNLVGLGKEEKVRT